MKEDIFERVNNHQIDMSIIEAKQLKYKAIEDIHLILSKLTSETKCNISELSCNHDIFEKVGGGNISTLDVSLDITF